MNKADDKKIKDIISDTETDEEIQNNDKQDCQEVDNQGEQEKPDENKETECEKDDSNKKDQAMLDDMSKQCEEYKDKLQRLAAEFDNYKKRTIREKERLYQDAICDTVSNFLPVVDNFERALDSVNSEDGQSFKDGIVMVAKQLKKVFEDLGVEKIETEDCKFDPNLHNAVMHVEDDEFEENVIIEELQTGYKYKDKVIRYSMVKVAN